VSAIGLGETGTVVVGCVAAVVVAVSVPFLVEPQPAARHAKTPNRSRRDLIAPSSARDASILGCMSLFGVVLLVAAAVLVLAAEWPRIAARTGLDERARRARGRRQSHLRVVESDTDDFARAVERDLANLPTIDPRERKKN
jgi:hypothetical protein